MKNNPHATKVTIHIVAIAAIGGNELVAFEIQHWQVLRKAPFW